MTKGRSRRRLETIAALALAAAAVVISAGREEGPKLGAKQLKLEKVGDFREPVYLAQPPKEDDLLFVVGRRGTVWVLKGGKRRPRPFLDIKQRVKAKGNEQGTFSIAFSPRYERDGLFYVSYTGHNGDVRIFEFKRSAADPLIAERSSARSVLRIPQNSSKHHGGQLVFGPDDYLYIGSGDGGPSFDPHETGQSRATLLGKMLRILPYKRGARPYTTPADNPFKRRHGRDEIYSYGLRNPWRFSFDRATGALTIGDVGQDRFEEIDILAAGAARGANFGWSAYEGFGRLKGGVRRKNTVLPALAYPHRRQACSVTGGFVVRDPQLARIKGRELVGRYLFGDYCTGRLRAFRPGLGKGEPGRDHGLGLRVPLLVSFGEDRAGHLYAISQEGPVYRIVATRKR